MLMRIERGFKSCQDCGSIKPVSEFVLEARRPCKQCHKVRVQNHNHQSRADCSISDCEWASYARGWCKAHYNHFYRWGHPTIKLAPSKSDHSVVRFGDMSYKDKRAFVVDKVCAICGRNDNLVVDHCHETNIVRDALCRNCNIGIGHLRDDVSLLQKAIEYIELHS